MNFDEDIIIEDQYGTDRNINDLLDIDDVNLEHENQKDFSNFLLKDKTREVNSGIDTRSIEDKNVRQYKDFKLPREAKDELLEGVIDDSSAGLILKQDKNFVFKWYLKSSIISVIFIVLFNVLTILITKDSETSFLSRVRAPYEVIIFLILSIYIIKFKKQTPKISAVSCALVGFLSGVLVSFFRLFYHMKLWTMFNIASESVFLLLEGLVLGFIFGAIFYGVDESLKNKN